jgi:hypothetical protein
LYATAAKRNFGTKMQSLEHKIEQATAIRTLGCRRVFTAASKRGLIITEGCVLRLIGKDGKIVCYQLFRDYVDANGDDAALAPLLATLKDDILVCYNHLETEQKTLKSSFVDITVVEPSTEASATPEVEAQIRVLEALKKTTQLPQLQKVSSDKWDARLKALDGNKRDVPKAEIGDPVPNGLNLTKNLRQGKKEPWCKAAERSIQAKIDDLRKLSKPPTADKLKRLKRDAFAGVFELVVRAVEAHEDKAIQAMPSEGPALTEALRKRFAPRAEAESQRYRAVRSEGCKGAHRKYKEQGVPHPGSIAAWKEKRKCKFGRIQTPKGTERAPNNMYPPYVAERIKAGFLKSKNLVRAWTNHKPRRKRANT